MDMKEPTVDAGESVAATDGNGPADPPADGGAMTAERDRLIDENHELMDRLLRRQAEFDNFRRRAEREKADVLEYANTETVRSILPILDDFERALKVDSGGKEYARGMELIHQRFSDALK